MATSMMAIERSIASTSTSAVLSSKPRCCRGLLTPALSRRSMRRMSLVKAKVDTEVKSDAEAATEKFGLEAGLLKVWTSKNAAGQTKADQAKELLTKYGSAYLVTSISLAIVSFGACYALVNAGVDVSGLLSSVGLQVNATNEKVGTFAIAYAAHKALSPVRFPPTVALTPVVAKFIGKKKEE